jgi:hypothetical protein
MSSEQFWQKRLDMPRFRAATSPAICYLKPHISPITSLQGVYSTRNKPILPKTLLLQVYF